MGSMRARRHFVLAGVAFWVLMTAVRPVGSAWAQERETWQKWSEARKAQVEETRGTVITSFNERGHLDAMRGHFETLGVGCCLMNGISGAGDYVYGVSNHGEGEERVVKKVLYSFSHGACKTVADGPRHVFKALALQGKWQALIDEVPPQSRVYPNDLPADLDYDFVLLTACHAGDPVFQGGENSNAAEMQAKFRADVFVSCKGGVWGANQLLCANCCPYESGKGFAPRFMTQIIAMRGQDKTFKEAFDEVDEIYRSRFVIKAGATTKIRDIFPGP